MTCDNCKKFLDEVKHIITDKEEVTGEWFSDESKKIYF